MTQHEHKRDFSRVAIEYKATMSISGVIINGQVMNLSMKGAFFISNSHIPKDAIVQLTVAIQEDPAISISGKGKVVRLAENGVGVEITELDIDSYMELKNILTYNSQDSSLVEQEIIKSIAKKVTE